MAKDAAQARLTRWERSHVELDPNRSGAGWIALRAGRPPTSAPGCADRDHVAGSERTAGLRRKLFLIEEIAAHRSRAAPLRTSRWVPAPIGEQRKRPLLQ